MAGLIEDIQRGALDPSVSVATLLRKMKFAASKLDLPALEAWVDHELNGYAGGEDGPEFRKLKGQVRVFNLYHGWQALTGSPGVINKMAQAWCGQSVAELESLVGRQDEDATFQLSLGPSVVQTLNKQNHGLISEAATFVSREQLLGIIEAVRNRILDWALQAEKEGIVGEGYEFEDSERASAQSAEATAAWNVTIGSFSGVLGSGNITAGQSIQQTINEPELFQQLAAAISSGVEQEADRKELLDAVTAMKEASGDRESFAAAYSDFVARAAAHLTIAMPFLPALTSLLQ